MTPDEYVAYNNGWEDALDILLEELEQDLQEEIFTHKIKELWERIQDIIVNVRHWE